MRVHRYKISIAILFVFTSFLAHSQDFVQQSRADRESAKKVQKMDREKIKEKSISSIVRYRREVTQGKSIAAEKLSSKAGYDSDGACTSWIDFKPNGKLRATYFDSYDQQGNVIESKMVDGNGKERWKNSISYDGAGNEAKLVFYNKGSTSRSWTTLNAFDENNNMTSSDLYQKENPKPFYRYVFSYHKDGSKKQTLQYNQKDKLIHTWNFECNPNGETEPATTKKDNRICERYETDSRGNQIRVVEEFSMDRRAARTVSRFNGNNRRIEETSYGKNGKIYAKNTWTYNTQDQLIASAYYGKNQEQPTSSWSCTYDEHGNVKESKETKNKGRKEIIYRNDYSFNK